MLAIRGDPSEVPRRVRKNRVSQDCGMGLHNPVQVESLGEIPRRFLNLFFLQK